MDAEKILSEITMLLYANNGSKWSDIIPKLRASIERAVTDAKAEQIETDARIAEGAKLPEHYQWSWDAIDHFTFGTSRAASAIRAQCRPESDSCLSA